MPRVPPRPVGIVAEVGEGVQGLEVGDKVACLGSPTYQRHALFHSSRVAKIPDQSADLVKWVMEPVVCAVHGVRIDQSTLITHRYLFDRAQQAFEAAANNPAGHMKGVPRF